MKKPTVYLFGSSAISQDFSQISIDRKTKLIQRHRVRGYFAPDIYLNKGDQIPNNAMVVRFPEVWEFQLQAA